MLSPSRVARCADSEHLVRALPRRNAWRRRLGLSSRDARREALVLYPTAACPACKSRDSAEERSAWGLLKHLDHLRPALEASDGLCLRHLVACLEQEGFEAEKAELLTVEKAKLEALQGELQEPVRKFDYRFSHELKGAEADSWCRAMAKISGAHHLDSGKPSAREGGAPTAHEHRKGTASQA